MFEIGEKVVCIKEFPTCLNGPKKHEIVTIHNFNLEVFFILSEYLFDSDGMNQAFLNTHFRKLDRQFTEDLLEKITKEVKREYIAKTLNEINENK